ncbi:hypothetical protein AD938_11235 [Gluconobacter japonicus]|nr:hypothetical protein AD938_11235 [Gluconobacter japonicus]
MTNFRLPKSKKTVIGILAAYARYKASECRICDRGLRHIVKKLDREAIYLGGPAVQRGQSL